MNSDIPQAIAHPRHFRGVFDRAERIFQNQWASAFTPNNTLFSGYLPILRTGNNELNSIYYGSCLSLVSRLRHDLVSNLNFPTILLNQAPHESISHSIGLLHGYTPATFFQNLHCMSGRPGSLRTSMPSLTQLPFSLSSISFSRAPIPLPTLL